MRKRHSLAFRKFQIWRDCQDHGWERSSEEIGSNIGIEAGHVRDTLIRAGWTGRIGDSEARSANSRVNGHRTNRHYGRSFDENTMDVTELMQGS